MARGDHIKVRRRGGLYTHHGIDLGDGTVIHFSGEPFRREDARICRVTMAEFLRGGRARVVRHPGPTRDPEETVRAAESMLAPQAYCVFQRNCEHFATWCKTGAWRSRQVRRAVHLAAGSAGAAVVLVAAALETRVRRA